MFVFLREQQDLLCFLTNAIPFCKWVFNFLLLSIGILLLFNWYTTRHVEIKKIRIIGSILFLLYKGFTSITRRVSLISHSHAERCFSPHDSKYNFLLWQELPFKMK